MAAIRSLDVELSWLSRAREAGMDQEVVPEEDSRRVVKETLEKTIDTAKEWQIDHVAHSASKLVRKIEKDKVTYSDIYYGVRHIVDDLQYGLSKQIVYRYPNDTWGIMESWQRDCSKVTNKFPSCRDDVAAGIDLWCLGHGTASVFHMMRILEAGLASLAADVNVKYDFQNWYSIINQIEKAIKAEQNAPKSSRKADRVQFLSEAAKEFSYFKDGWRNYVSHAKGAYEPTSSEKRNRACKAIYGNAEPTS